MGQTQTSFGKLSSDITWPYKLAESKKKTWNTGGSTPLEFFYKEFPANSDEFQKVLDILKGLDGGGLDVDKIYGVYNPSLVQSFMNRLKIFETRLSQAPGIFDKSSLYKNDSKKSNLNKNDVYQMYLDRVQLYSWNSELKVPIIPCVHATRDLNSAWEISSNGFQSTAEDSNGKFGQGVYFTTDALYSLPLAYPENSVLESPCVIISYVIPGNVFPVTEKSNSATSLIGNPIKSGYNAHYIVVDKTGEAVDTVNNFKDKMFEEMVISQDSQITPAFVVQLKKSSSYTIE